MVTCRDQKGRAVAKRRMPQNTYQVLYDRRKYRHGQFLIYFDFDVLLHLQPTAPPTVDNPPRGQMIIRPLQKKLWNYL